MSKLFSREARTGAKWWAKQLGYEPRHSKEALERFEVTLTSKIEECLSRGRVVMYVDYTPQTPALLEALEESGIDWGRSSFPPKAVMEITMTQVMVSSGGEFVELDLIEG